MLRTIAAASLVLAAIPGGAVQATSVLHIKVSIIDADQRTVPLAQHALLISDNPATAAPRRVVTTPGGTADIRLRPGNYTVESDGPTAAGGRAYEWREIVDIVAGRDTTLELTAANATIGPVTAEMEATPARADESRSSPIFAKWRNSVVALWTAHRHAAGFIVGQGLVATSQSGIGDATSLEVQLSDTEKVAGRVVAADAGQDVAIVQIDPGVAAAVPPVPLACASAAADGLTRTQDLLTIDVPLFGAKGETSGGIVDLGPQVIETDLALADSSAGGPVFAGEGPAIGLTSMPENDAVVERGHVRVVRAPAICAALASAEHHSAASPPPAATRLPVESSRPLPLADMKAAALAHGFSLSSYASSSSDFDILFITPVVLAGAELQRGRAEGLAEPPSDTLSGLRAATDFGEWSAYVSAAPPVLFIRATPRLVESFWMKLARGAAYTQGGSIPPIKHVGPGFSRMRLFCGSREITPVHPFGIRSRVSDTEAVDEGFYAFDPTAVGPQCGTVSLVLSSVKDPGKTETKVVDPALAARVWKDFAGYMER